MLQEGIPHYMARRSGTRAQLKARRKLALVDGQFIPRKGPRKPRPDPCTSRFVGLFGTVRDFPQELRRLIDQAVLLKRQGLWALAMKNLAKAKGN